MSLLGDVNQEAALRQQQKLRDMVQRYKNVFGTPEGRLVLGDILLTCHWGVPLMGEEQRLEYNIGIYIARMCGIMSDIDAMVGIRED